MTSFLMATCNDFPTRHPREFVTCTICSKLYQDPRVLPCSHTFCIQCIRKSVENGIFKCPREDDTTIDGNDITSLPTSQTVKDNLEFMLRVNLISEYGSNHECKNCDENQAIFWCEKCAQYYCESCCNTIHSNRALQSHSVILSTERMSPICSEHDDNFRYWCTQCKVLICRDCILFQHKDHSYSSLNDEVSIARRRFQETMQRLNQIETRSAAFLRTTREVLNDQCELAQQEERRIEQTFAELRQLLEERKRAMIQQLKDQALETKNRLHNQQAVLDQRLNLITLQQVSIQKMRDSNDLMRILDFDTKFHQNYSNFDEQNTEINEGYTIKRYLFKRDDRDIEQISNIISKLGYTTTTALVVRDESVTIRTLPLDILRPDVNTRAPRADPGAGGERNIARGYRFKLKRTLRLQAVRVYFDQIAQITCFITNDVGLIIQNSTITSTEATMRWLSIPMECDLPNNYSILVVTSSNSGLCTCRNGDNRLQVINDDCSVESIYTHAVAQVTNGPRILLYNSNTAIYMMLDTVDGQ